MNVSTSLAFTVPAIVQAVAETVDCRKMFAAVVRSEAVQDQPFGAVVPAVMMNVLAPVVPVQVACPAHAPPFCVVIVAQAPVPVSPAAVPAAT